MSKSDVDRPDIVDVFYHPFIRPLGNLVITFARCEAALLEMLAAAIPGGEAEAREALKAPDAKAIATRTVETSGLDGFALEEALEMIERFWALREDRNRLMHDEWFVGIDPGLGAGVGTRGLPRKRGSGVVWGEPDVEEVWRLGEAFREIRSAFSSYAAMIEARRGA